MGSLLAELESAHSPELIAACKAKFRHLTTAQLIARTEAAPDFKYDDEAIELTRRLALKGHSWPWSQSFSPAIEVYKP